MRLPWPLPAAARNSQHHGHTRPTRYHIEVPHGAGSVVVLDPGLKELTHGGLLLLGLPWARASNRGRQAAAGSQQGRC